MPAASVEAEGRLAPHTLIIVICLMIATLMQALDTTVANVALPYMQGSLSASHDQITWVLTSYIIASAIFTAPVGWLTARFGRKNLMLACLISFIITSVMCGLASSLPEIVVERFLQGMFGAALVPLSQSTMLDLFPPERRGISMSIWSSGVMLGPIIGPTLGGFLTAQYDWRYVFFINVPFGILAILGLLFFMPRVESDKTLRFDWIGFLILALGLTAMQIALDRGEQLDWFSSGTIVTCTVVAALGLYLFVVHMMTADNPFIPRTAFADLNFNGALIVMVTVGLSTLSSTALLGPFLENLSNYPVQSAGMVMAPRGLGMIASMMLAGRLTNRFDPRLLMLFGYGVLETAMVMQEGWTPGVSPGHIALTTILSGAGLGFVFVPLNVLAYATLPVALRTQGAALSALMRNIGSAVGIAVTSAMLDRQTQVEHAVLAQYVTPFTRPMQSFVNVMLDPASPAGASLLNSIVDTQSQIIAYADDYKLIFLTTIPAIMCVFFMRPPKAS